MTEPRARAAIEPRFLSREEASGYCGVSPGTFDGWVLAGIVPKPLSLINGRTKGPLDRKLWDRRLLDAALDRLSGIGTASLPDQGERLRRAREAQAR